MSIGRHVRKWYDAPFATEADANKYRDECGHFAEPPRFGAARISVLTPPDKVKLEYRERIEGGRIVKDDPIVLQPVDGGYLVVTAWGDEASDPLVVNANRN
jgi:hypothetical protein